MRRLNAYIDQRLVGTLSEGDDLWAFEYDTGWIDAADGFDLSPALPRSEGRIADGGSLRPVQWYFDNLLPEERLREAVAKESAIPQDDAFGLLEFLGAESAGSLTLLPPGVASSAEGRWRALTNDELSRRIAALPGVTLASTAPKRMSIAGAQHKLLVVIEGGRLYEPEGRTPSTHILKPDHPNRNFYPASTLNEYLTMRLARDAKLAVPAVELRYVPEPIYIIKRFDRLTERGQVRDGGALQSTQRLHIIDGCQILNKARGFKYRGATLESLKDMIEATSNKAATRTALFRWLVFNVIVANDDCHLKNLSFHIGPEGISLAPHYDLLCTCAYHTPLFSEAGAHWPNIPLLYPLPGASTFAELTIDSLVLAGTELGLPVAMSHRMITEVATRIRRSFEAEMLAYDTWTSQTSREQAHLIGAQRQLLSVIQNITLREMLAKVLS